MSKEVLFQFSWFNLSLLPWNMVKDNSAPKHQIIIAQIQKIGIWQVAASDEDTSHQNGKPSFSASLQPLTYDHYFSTLLISSLDLADHGNQLSDIDSFHPKFSIVMCYAHPPL